MQQKTHSYFDFDIVNMENIFTAVKPFYYLAKVLGLFPMSLLGLEVKGTFVTKWHGVFASIFSVSIAFLLLFLNLFLNDGPTSSSQMLSDMLRVQAVFSLILIIVQFFYQYSKCSSIVKFLKDLNEIDHQVIESWLWTK